MRIDTVNVKRQEETLTFQQHENGVFVYPSSSWRKLAWRLPLIFYRLGLGLILRPLPMILLTTHGRRTGSPRHVMVEHSFVEGKIYVVPGWGERTQWYRNIQADPHVTVQRRGQSFSAIASRVTDQSELSAVFDQVQRTSPMWKPFLNSWGIEDNLEDFLSKRDRVVALRLDCTEDLPMLPPLPADLWWVWPLLAVLGLLIWHWQA